MARTAQPRRKRHAYVTASGRRRGCAIKAFDANFGGITEADQELAELKIAACGGRQRFETVRQASVAQNVFAASPFAGPAV